MGVLVFNPLTQQIHFFFFFFFIFIFFFLVEPSFGEHDITTTSSSPSPPPPPPPPHQEQTDTSPFRPSIAVIVGVLTTMFSITFLLLLYAKHCKHGSVVIYSSNHHAGGNGGLAPSSDRKNSGIDRVVVESLPLFRFGSLRGQKDGLECAVCLTRFDPTAVLRLLPKCKHAFHVECVDTWLDSHSTCPLCRYRVDPEDILLLQDVNNMFHFHHHPQTQGSPKRQDDLALDMDHQGPDPNPVGFRRVSGRHSSAGEGGGRVGNNTTTSFSRRSLDSVKMTSESVAVGCFDRPRKDGLLLTDGVERERRFEHRIIVSAAGFHQRWSDVQPSDLLYLRSEMIISDSRRFSLGSSRPSVRKQQQQPDTNIIVIENGNNSSTGSGSGSGSASGVINTRSVSEITGLSRFSARESNGFNRNSRRQRQEGLVSRWLAWMSSQTQAQTQSQSQSHCQPNPHQPHVPSDPNAHTSNVV